MKSNYRVNYPKDWKKLIEKEVNEQISQAVLSEEADFLALVLWLLHTEYGFGKKRLEHFAEEFDKRLNELSEWYAMPTTDQVFLCRRKLKEYGIDVDEIIKKKEGIICVQK